MLDPFVIIAVILGRLGGWLITAIKLAFLAIFTSLMVQMTIANVWQWLT